MLLKTLKTSIQSAFQAPEGRKKIAHGVSRGIRRGDNIDAAPEGRKKIAEGNRRNQCHVHHRAGSSVEIARRSLCANSFAPPGLKRCTRHSFPTAHAVGYSLSPLRGFTIARRGS